MKLGHGLGLSGLLPVIEEYIAPDAELIGAPMARAGMRQGRG